MKIAVIGTGYVGLVVGAGFADFGNDVVCIDSDEAKIDKLHFLGQLPIHEPGLDDLVKRNATAGRLRFTTDRSAAQDAEVIFLAVGTPSAHDGSADLTALLGAVHGLRIAPGAVVVTKSTVPVGTTDKIETILDNIGKYNVVASNPEFLKEGDAVNDFMKPDRIIIGTRSERAENILRHLYAPFVRTNDRILVMDPCSAELTKYASNAYLATRISFMNEIATLCEHVDADVEMVRRGMGMDPRIGNKFLFPGVGYGGSCFPKDVRALIALTNEKIGKSNIIEAAHHVNVWQPRAFVGKIRRHFGGPASFGDSLKGLSFAVWGLAFKPNTDDVREAPSLSIIENLMDAGAKVTAYDPVANESFRAENKKVALCDDAYKAVEGADALLLLTEWHQFRRPDFHKLKALMKQPVLFDGRNVWDPGAVAKLGFTYYGVGRKQEVDLK